MNINRSTFIFLGFWGFGVLGFWGTAANRAARTRRPLAVVLSPEEAMARDVQLALETSGFSKAKAQAATRGVAATDKHSLENSIRAAFRKLNKVAA